MLKLDQSDGFSPGNYFEKMDTQNRYTAVVGIGASAGGLDALREFFRAMPPDSGAAFVVIQHLDPSHTSHMADILAKSTGMNVVEAQDGMPVEADSVFTIPPDKFLKIQKGSLHLTETVKPVIECIEQTASQLKLPRPTGASGTYASLEFHVIAR